MENYLESLKGKEIEVIYRGFTYKGILKDTLESEILLELDGELLTIPFEEISSINSRQ